VPETRIVTTIIILSIISVDLDGRKKKEAAEIFGVMRQAIGKWIKAS